MASLKCRKTGRIVVCLCGFVIVSMSGCADMGYTGSGLDLPQLDTSNMTLSSVGATTGAVLGAGLGTLIGASSGNAGEGLVLGSLAGAAAGGAVGYNLEETRGRLTNQQEILKEQQETIGRQNREIADLRNSMEDRVGSKYHREKTKSSNPSNLLRSSRVSSPSVSEQSIDITAPAVGDSPALGNSLAHEDTAFPPARSLPQVKSVADDSDWLRESARPSSLNTSVNKSSLHNEAQDSDFVVNEKPVQLSPVKKTSLVKAKRLDEVKKIRVIRVKERGKIDPVDVLARSDVKSRNVVKPVKHEEKEVRSSNAFAKSVTSEKEVVLKEKVAEKTDKVAQRIQTQPMQAPMQAKAPATSQPETSQTTVAAVKQQDPACLKAGEEAKRASASKSAADKLFYYRRALRVCPSEAKYHYEIGKVYSLIGRNEDAIYELRQAVDLSPDMTDAKNELNKLGGQ